MTSGEGVVSGLTGTGSKDVLTREPPIWNESGPSVCIGKSHSFTFPQGPPWSS